METSVAQRWREGFGSFRPKDEPFATLRYEIAPIPGDNEAKKFIVRHHYSRSYPAARERVGLYTCTGELVGVAVFSVPTNDRAFEVGFTTSSGELLVNIPRCTELGRLVLLNSVPGNAETWFLRRCFWLLRESGYDGVLSMSDPVPRADVGGRVVFPGHVGGIYQGLNGVYRGLATARTIHLLPDGRVVNARALQKIRDRSKGWEYAVGDLVEMGAVGPASSEDLRVWLRRELGRVTRTMRHGGNHRYVWLLNKRRHQRDLAPLCQPYPKFNLPALAA